MTVDRHPDWYETVRSQWRKTKGFLLASREPCLAIRKDEHSAVRGRSLAGRDLAELGTWQPPTSWILGVVVCPGDTVDGIVAWVRQGKHDPARVHFYLHPSTPWDVLHPWVDAGFDTDQAATVTDWRQLHRLYGLALNDRCYADWKGAE